MIKRIIDVVLALILLISLSPVILFVSVIILVTMGRPILYRQLRPGRNGVPFQMVKFRTMREGSRPDADRLTAFGRFLRVTSLDELPELVNVVRGDMSLIGPRPLLMEYLSLYSDEQQRRHEVRPGITGWAQVNGRNTISWDDKFKLDVWYVDNQSLWLDLKIIGMTMRSVLRREGISHPGEATMKKFSGNR